MKILRRVAMIVLAGAALPSLAEAALLNRTIFAELGGIESQVGLLTYDDARAVFVEPDFIQDPRFDPAYVVTNLFWRSSSLDATFVYEETASTLNLPAVYFPGADVVYRLATDRPSVASLDLTVRAGLVTNELVISIGDGVVGRYLGYSTIVESIAGSYRTVPGGVVPLPAGFILIGSALATLGIARSVRSRR